MPRPLLMRGRFLHRDIDAAAGLGDALDLADHRLAVEILQLDLELAAAVGMRHAGVAADDSLRS